jgi:hypothetical protein
LGSETRENATPSTREREPVWGDEERVDHDSKCDDCMTEEELKEAKERGERGKTGA